MKVMLAWSKLNPSGAVSILRDSPWSWLEAGKAQTVRTSISHACCIPLHCWIQQHCCQCCSCLGGDLALDAKQTNVLLLALMLGVAFPRPTKLELHYFIEPSLTSHLSLTFKGPHEVFWHQFNQCLKRNQTNKFSWAFELFLFCIAVIFLRPSGEKEIGAIS